jgi:hypothetical protein
MFASAQMRVDATPTFLIHGAKIKDAASLGTRRET